MWNAKQAMTWNPGAHGFNMTLSSEVPELIEEDLLPLYDRALEKAGRSREDVRHWCIHPGGVRILQAVRNCLGLDETALGSSCKVLREYGNMSSATLLFVLKDMWSVLAEHTSAPVFAAAFGPGLAMESMVMTVS